MKNNMTILISVGIALALLVGYYFYVLYQVEVPEQYKSVDPEISFSKADVVCKGPNWGGNPEIPFCTETQLGGFSTNVPPDLIFAGATTPIAPSHIVSVPPGTYSKITAYAFPKGITVSDALSFMVDSFSTTTLNDLYQKGVKDGIAKEATDQVSAVASCKLSPNGVVAFADRSTGKVYSFYCKDMIEGK